MLYTQMQNIFENNFKLLLTDNVSTSGVILGPVNAQANPSHPCPLPLLHTYPDLGTHPLRVHASSRGGGGGPPCPRSLHPSFPQQIGIGSCKPCF